MTSLKANIKGFTIIEMLVTMALTSLILIVAYSVLNYSQKLFYQFKDQNEFINKYLRIKNKLKSELNNADYLKSNTDEKFCIVKDTCVCEIEFIGKQLVINKSGQCDTLMISENKLRIIYNRDILGKGIVDSLIIPIRYSDQTFEIVLSKQMDADVKLKYLTLDGAD